MKILFITKELPYPLTNGHRIRTLSLLKGFQTHGQIDLLCLSKNKEKNSSHEEIKKYCNTIKYLNLDLNISKIKTIYTLLTSFLSTLPFSIKLRHSENIKNEIETNIKNTEYNIIICDGIHIALNIPDDFKGKKILIEHNIESQIIKRYLEIEKNPIKKILAKKEYKKFYRFENEIWKKFDIILPCSETEKTDIQNRIKQTNIKVIPNGIDLTKYIKNHEIIEKNTLIYTGLMGWHPNEDAVLFFINQIYPLIKKEIKDIKLNIVGKGPKKKLKQIAEKDSSILLTGFVEDIQEYIKKSEIVIVPLRIGSGTRLKILEAFALEKTVVSTTIGCEGLEVTHKENILIADKPIDFANEIINCLMNKDCKAIGKNGRKLVEEKYSWDVVGNKIKVLEIN